MKDKSYINEEIKRNYLREDSKKLARRLGITVEYLRVKAGRLGVHRRFTNEIINGKKLCPRCNRRLPVESFYKDKYQLNGLDYYCKECRAKEKSEHKNKKDSGSSSRRASGEKVKFSLATGRKRIHNPVIMHNGVRSLKCLQCKEIKPLACFHKASRNTSGRVNTCKSCVSENTKKAYANAKKKLK